MRHRHDFVLAPSNMLFQKLGARVAVTACKRIDNPIAVMVSNPARRAPRSIHRTNCIRALMFSRTRDICRFPAKETRRMEDGYPGTALHTFLRALHVLGRLEDMVKVMATENDTLGMELMREQLPHAGAGLLLAAKHGLVVLLLPKRAPLMTSMSWRASDRHQGIQAGIGALQGCVIPSRDHRLRRYRSMISNSRWHDAATCCSGAVATPSRRPGKTQDGVPNHADSGDGAMPMVIASRTICASGAPSGSLRSTARPAFTHSASRILSCSHSASRWAE